MREQGTVISRQEQVALVRVARSPQCQGCAGCIEWGISGERVIEVDNRFGAEVGAVVECETAASQVLGHSILLFLFPLVAMLGGYWLVRRWPAAAGRSEGAGILGAFAAAAAAFALIRLFDRRWSRRHRTVATITGLASLADLPAAPLSCTIRKP